MKLTTDIVNRRHDMDSESLTEFVIQNFEGNLLTLRQLEPFISEVKRRFRTLPRTPDVHGNRPTISGCKNFATWCQKVLRRTDRTVRYMLAKAKEKKLKETIAETVSALTKEQEAEKEQQRVITYIEKSKLNPELRRVLLKSLKWRTTNASDIFAGRTT